MIEHPRDSNRAPPDSEQEPTPRSRKRSAAKGAPAGLPDKTTGRSSARRQELLDTAARLFYERGYSGFTMDELASRLKINKASLYHYVDSKESLIFAVFEESARIGFDTFDAILLDDKASVMVRCRRFIRTYVVLCCTNIYFRATCLRGTLDLPERHRELVLRNYGRLDGNFAKLIEQGQKQRVIGKMNPRMAARAVIGACCWVVQWNEIAHADPEDIAKSFESILSRALFNLPGSDFAELDSSEARSDLTTALSLVQEGGALLKRAATALIKTKSKLED
jgi:TetR/AcrR family transcriptional regulator, cholesterol catabolism regulator